MKKIEIAFTKTLKRAKLIARKTGKIAITQRNGFVKVVIPIVPEDKRIIEEVVEEL